MTMTEQAEARISSSSASWSRHRLFANKQALRRQVEEQPCSNKLAKVSGKTAGSPDQRRRPQDSTMVCRHLDRWGPDAGKSITERRLSQAAAARGSRRSQRLTISLLALSLSLHLAVSCAGATRHHHLLAETESQTTTTTTKALEHNKTQVESNNDNVNTISARIIKIPGLYDERENPWIQPLQGQANFERLIYKETAANKSEVAEATVSLIQYYMATCPDCQGFSPYFKRFVRDIGPHWRHLVRIYTINCNDEININLCWQQNPNLIVPLVRWYTFSPILQDHYNISTGSKGARLFENYPTDLLNVAHRSYIKKQRRDLISLRHATLRYIQSILDQLTTSSSSAVAQNDHSGDFYSRLPVTFKLLKPLGGGGGKSRSTTGGELAKFQHDLGARIRECSQSRPANVENFIVFERPGSYVGRTLVADWSNWTCSSGPAKQEGDKVMFHYSDNLNLLSELKILDSKQQKVSINHKDAQLKQPFLLHLETRSPVAHDSLDKLEFALLASNDSSATILRYRRHLASHSADHEHLSLEKYYNSRKFRNPIANNAYRLEGSHQANRVVKKRLRRSTTADAKSVDYNEAENINWGPEYIYPGEESIRFKFNQIVAEKMGKFTQMEEWQIPGVELRGENPGEIARAKQNSNGVTAPKDDDLTLLKLTDFYKVLDEIVHKNLVSRAELDGYQLVATTCFIRHLWRQFPFQGQQTDQQQQQQHQKSSIARHYLELMYQRFGSLIQERGGAGSFQGCDGDLLDEQRNQLEQMRVGSRELQRIQDQTRKEFDIGLPSEKHFRWQYCAGSSEYLRGHTCSLWILFHTLTVHEYLGRGGATPAPTTGGQCAKRQHTANGTASENQNQNQNDHHKAYRFMIKYSQDTKKCDPANPEPALVSAKTSELFEGPLNRVLASIINFVRYHLSCTNCAAHFSCMVKNSPGLELCEPRSPDDHILWLWEAHNRVNVRTKSTHSEDPTRPKHVFPVYEACPECYLEQPANQTAFEQMKFDRKALVEFMVSRYRKSAILNNKIKIEDLFRKQPPAPAHYGAVLVSASGSNNSSLQPAGGESAKLSHKLTAYLM